MFEVILLVMSACVLETLVLVNLPYFVSLASFL